MAAALYNMALRQVSSIQSDLGRLESEPPSSSTSVALQGQITASMSALGRTIEDYESLSKREMNEAKREKAMSRVKKFREDEREMRNNFIRIKNRDHLAFQPDAEQGGTTGSSSFNTYASSSARAGGAAAASMESPFSLHARNSAAASPYSSSARQQQADPLVAYRMNASAQAMFGDGSSGEFSARENHALREHSFIQNTEAQLDAFIAQGREVWSNLTEQRDILKGTQRKLLDAANTMGLSRNIINMIERRSTHDNVIFAAGAIFTLICFCEFLKSAVAGRAALPLLLITAMLTTYIQIASTNGLGDAHGTPSASRVYSSLLLLERVHVERQTRSTCSRRKKSHGGRRLNASHTLASS